MNNDSGCQAMQGFAETMGMKMRFGRNIWCGSSMEFIRLSSVISEIITREHALNVPHSCKI
jgi:hypothetical protein